MKSFEQFNDPSTAANSLWSTAEQIWSAHANNPDLKGIITKDPYSGSDAERMQLSAIDPETDKPTRFVLTQEAVAAGGLRRFTGTKKDTRFTVRTPQVAAIVTKSPKEGSQANLTAEVGERPANDVEALDVAGKAVSLLKASQPVTPEVKDALDFDEQKRTEEPK